MRWILLAFGLIALALPVAVAGLFEVVQQLVTINQAVAGVREAQLLDADVNRLQAEEAWAIRAYAATHDPTFLPPYTHAVRALATRVAPFLARMDPSAATAQQRTRHDRALLDALAANAAWRTTVAAAILRERGAPRTRAIPVPPAFIAQLVRGDAGLAADYRELLRRRGADIRAASTIGFAAIGVVGLQIIVFGVLTVRLRSELNRERRVVEVLQRAFAGEMRPTPDLDVATTYVSATRGATVGGDVFDVFPIDDVRTLIALADVSGKGVEAAIDSTFVKYGLRAFASEHTDPATIVARFNALYVRAERPPEAFVVLFAGIYDRAAGTLAYVNAGHEAAYIRRPNGVEALLPTDPVIGLSGDARFTVVTTTLTSADTLFLSTDGLTEARDPSGAFLGDARVRAWLAAAETGSMNELVAAITQRLRRYTRARSRDDLAIVALRPSPATD